MLPRFFLTLPIGVLLLGGCQPSDEAPGADTGAARVPLSSLPNQRRRVEAKKAAQAVLLAPAPALSELTSSALPTFEAPPAGSLASLYLAYLKPTKPKRSLLILEPQNAGNESFFAGCARWMKFFGAGSTAFDSGTTWGMADDVRRARGWESLALERGRAVQLGRALDATHVALASVQKGVLTYQVLDVSIMPSRIVGTFSLRGTKAQMVAELPRLTRQIAAAAGAQKLAVPSRVGLSSADLAFVGALPFRIIGKTRMIPAQQKRLASLAGQPLGAMFVARLGQSDAQVLTRGAKTLLALTPRNAAAGAEVTNYWNIETPRVTAALRRLSVQLPRHLSVAIANVSLHERQLDYFAQVHYAEMAVRSAPHSAFAWNRLSEAISNQAEEKRQSKYYEDLTTDEKVELEKLYPRALVAAWKATQLEPGEAFYWTTLSIASTFDGNSQWALDALAQSLRLDPSNEIALNWGLQIFQPKWFGDAPSFAKMARIAVENARGSDLNVRGLCEGLEKTNQQALKRPLLEILLKNEPENVMALVRYSNALRMETGNSERSYRLARRAVQIAPNSVDALEELGDIEQHDRGEYAQAIVHMHKAATLDPQNGVLWVNLALPYAKSGQRAKARTMAIKGRNLGYRGPHPAWNMVGLASDGSEPGAISPAQPASP